MIRRLRNRERERREIEGRKRTREEGETESTFSKGTSSVFRILLTSLSLPLKTYPIDSVIDAQGNLASTFSSIQAG